MRGFDQRIDNQLIEIFDIVPGGNEAPLGHYYVANGGDIDARGWAVSMTHEVPGYLRGTIEYTASSAYWDPMSDMTMSRAVRSMPISSVASCAAARRRSPCAAPAAAAASSTSPPARGWNGAAAPAWRPTPPARRRWRR
jgi:hypothetical protein